MPELGLPPGLSPVTAGRFGLWLLGKRAHRKALRRRSHVDRAYRVTLPSKFIRLLAPWRIEEYPGWARLLSDTCGVARGTAKNWMGSDARLPRKHALTLAAICESRAAEFLALAEELRAHAAAVPEVRPPRRKVDPV